MLLHADIVMLTYGKWAQWKHQNQADATADEWLASELG